MGESLRHASPERTKRVPTPESDFKPRKNIQEEKGNLWWEFIWIILWSELKLWLENTYKV